MRGVTACLLGALCVSLLFAFVNVVGAESPSPYARVSGLAVFPSESDVNFPPIQSKGTADLDGTVGVAGAVGMDWTHGWQTEVEVGYRSMDVSSLALTIPGIGHVNAEVIGVDWKTLTVMANVRYVLKPETVFNQSWGGIHPYVAGGGGVAFHDLEIGSLTTDNDTVAAYQAMAGLSYDITADLSTHVGYRYVGTADFEYNSSTATYDTHGLEFGLAYLFF